MKAATTILILFIFSAGSPVVAQYDAPLFASYTTSEARLQLNERVIQNIIIRNLNYPLHSDTEENWQDAFTAMEVYKYNSAFTTARIALAFTNAYSLSINFQRALLEVAFTNYPAVFEQEVLSLMQYTNNPRNFAMCAEYLLAGQNTPELRNRISKAMIEKFNTDISIDDLSKIVPLSRRNLEIKFKNEMDTTIYQFILKLRIEHFTNLLLTTDRSLFDLALESGFNDCKNISRIFKKFKGSTPTEYRNKMKDIDCE